MALDFPAAGNALWAIYDATGIRPEYLIPVLSYESGLRPDLPNGQGAPYYGIGQNSAGDIASYTGVDPATYLTWTASQQLSTVVKSYFQAIVSKFGPLNSGTRVYQAEYLPATLPTVTSLDGVLSSAPSPYYESNLSFDIGRKGYITLGDLSQIVSIQASKGYVQTAIANTYALRPGESPQDPVYGTDFGAGSISAIAKPLLLATSVLVLAGILAEAISPGSSPFSPRRRRARIFAI